MILDKPLEGVVVDQRLHPAGREGSLLSLKEVAERSWKARMSPRLRAWVTQKLDAQGFKHVQALQAVHGHWEGEAFQHGQLVKFHADAKTGQVTFEKAKDNARGNN